MLLSESIPIVLQKNQLICKLFSTKNTETAFKTSKAGIVIKVKIFHSVISFSVVHLSFLRISHVIKIVVPIPTSIEIIIENIAIHFVYLSYK